MYLKIAWRNIWRNRRRTLITASSIFFAVILSIFMRSTISGVFEKMTTDIVGFSSGYIQVHQKGYWNEQSIDNTFEEDNDLFRLLENDPSVTAWSPRLESFALSSSGDRTKGIIIMGILPEKETAVTHLEEKIVAGQYIRENDNGVLLGEGLAAYLGLGVKDTLVVLGQGYHGTMAAGKYPVRGIVHLGSPELNKSVAWLPLGLCRELFGTEKRLSSVSIMVSNMQELDEVKMRLQASAGNQAYEVMTWKEMLPELDQLIEGDKGAHFITINILYLVITFGIFGTIMMMMNERMHEFGIMISIGMKKRFVALIVFLEIVFISGIGTLAGAAAALPVVLYVHRHPFAFTGQIAKAYESFGVDPVIQPSTAPENFISQVYIVFSITAVLSLYPVYKIARLNIIKVLNS